jgi:hypothetical protein
MRGIGDRDALIQNLIGVIDLAAARAREIAAKERLEHQHERIAFVSPEVLSDDVGTYRQSLA